MVGFDKWTRVPRADFVIIKIYYFDHKHILPIVHVLVVLVVDDDYLPSHSS